MHPLKFFLALATLAIWSCHSHEIPQATANFTHFDVEKNLEAEPLYQLQDVVPDGLLLFHDTLLVIRNAPARSLTHFIALNIDQKKLSRGFLPAGRKPGQSLSFLSYGLLNDDIWVNDIIKEKLLLLNLGSAQTNGMPAEYKMPVFYYSVQLLNDSTLVGAGNYNGDYKIYLLNLASGKVTDQMIPYRTGSDSLVSRQKKMAYESFVFLKPSGEKCVLACRYADQIEIVNLKERSSTIIKGPEGYAPDVMEAIGNDGKMLSKRNEYTRYSFVKGKTTDSYIYLLYSGNNHLSEHLYYGSCLYVYDWNGRPVQKLKFADDVLDFAVTHDNKTLYAYHPGNKFITVSKLPSNETN